MTLPRARFFFPVLVCLVVAAALVGGRDLLRPKRPNIIMVVVDTLRADRLGCYGDAAAATPFLDSLAARGLRFERAYAASSWTMPSVASLLTSRYPSQHLVTGLTSRLGDDEVSVVEQLWWIGYRTAGFSANCLLTREHGYVQGFDWWESPLPEVGAGERVRKVRARTLRKSAMDWLDSQPDSAQRPPLFLYFQFMETHAPLKPPMDLRERFAPGLADAALDRINAKAIAQDSALKTEITQAEIEVLGKVYRAAVAEIDREIEALFGELERRGLLDDALVVVTADHGEEFFDHGGIGHGSDLFEETVRVPLILVGPMIEPGVVAEPISQIDLAPTLNALGRALPEARFEGRSRDGLVRNDWVARVRRWWDGIERADVYLQLFSFSPTSRLPAHEAGLVHGTEKILVDPAGQSALYDLARDPGEKAPLQAASRSRELAAAIDTRYRDFARRKAATAETVTIDPATAERLRALGYQQ